MLDMELITDWDMKKILCDDNTLARISQRVTPSIGDQMHSVRIAALPLIGSSYNFVGADQGDVAVSMFIVQAQPGRGAPLHFHEYDEIVMVQEGTSRVVVGDVIRDVIPGEILVIKAGTPHGFVNSGTNILKQIDIHLSPRFAQELVEPTETSRRAGLPIASAV